VFDHSALGYAHPAAGCEHSDRKEVAVVYPACEVGVVCGCDAEDAQEGEVGGAGVVVRVVVEGFVEEAVVGLDLEVLVYFSDV
jgi:hypothetical protein